MEMLVVVVIALLIAAIAIPSFVRSLQGQRLRTSARTFVIAHKYARNMAVLRQTRMAVLVDRAAGKVEVVSIPDRDALAGRSKFLDSRGAEQDLTTDDAEADTGGIQIEQGRQLGRNVEVADFSTEREGQEIDGIYWVNYYPSGMSDGFTASIRDERGKQAKIETDPYSGGVEVDFR